MIHYPLFHTHKSSPHFDDKELCNYKQILPTEYKTWVENIDRKFMDNLFKVAKSIQSGFRLATSDFYPNLVWEESRGLRAIIADEDGQLARQTEDPDCPDAFYFEKIHNPFQALALTMMISTYLNDLQELPANRLHLATGATK